MDYDSLSDDELADMIRPVTLLGEEEYIADADVDTARAIRARKFEDTGGHPAHGLLPDPPVPRNIIGADGRFAEYASYYPNRAIIVTSSAPLTINGYNYGCTATLIGPSTAITSAHCFYNAPGNAPGYPVGWQPVKYWASGVRSAGGVVTVQYGIYQGCYWVTFPNGWTGLDTLDNDYAVIEYANPWPTCNLSPGNALGWLGWWNANAGQIASVVSEVLGYPGPAPSTAAPWPSLYYGAENAYYSGNPNATQQNGGSDELDTGLDLTGGQSGSSILQPIFDTADEYSTGIVSRAPATPGSFNKARKIDGTVIAFVQANSNL